jgi:hypothetical protein
MLPPVVRIALAAVITLALICPLAISQSHDRASPQPGVLSFDDVDVPQALDKIGEHFGVKVLSHGKLDKKVTATLRDADIAQALTSVTSPLGYRWRKITLAVKDGEEVTAARLYGIVTALEKVGTASAIVDNPGEKTRLAFRRSPDEEPAGSEALTGESYKTYYLVYNPKPTITFAPPAPPKGQGATGQTPSSPAGLVDWFSSLDRETQSALLGQLMGSMMGNGEGVVSLSIGVGADAEAGGGQSSVVIRKLGPEEGEGQ